MYLSFDLNRTPGSITFHFQISGISPFITNLLVSANFDRVVSARLTTSKRIRPRISFTKIWNKPRLLLGSDSLYFAMLQVKYFCIHPASLVWNSITGLWGPDRNVCKRKCRRQYFYMAILWRSLLIVFNRDSPILSRSDTSVVEREPSSRNDGSSEYFHFYSTINLQVWLAILFCDRGGIYQYKAAKHPLWRNLVFSYLSDCFH